MMQSVVQVHRLRDGSIELVGHGWTQWLSKKEAGNLYDDMYFAVREDTDRPSASMELHPSEESRYTAKIVERITDLTGGDDVVAELDTFEYRWHAGYEELLVQRYGAGSLNYSGTYHPDGHCDLGGEESGVCSYCGTVWM
jgi:hypothetical protein